MASITALRLPRRAEHARADRIWGTVIGTLAAVVIAVGLSKPRTFAATYVVLVAAMIAADMWLQWQTVGQVGPVQRRYPVARRIVVAAAALLAWAGLSALWSPGPMQSLGKAAVAAVFVFGAVAACLGVVRAREPDAFRLGEGIWIGVLAGAVYLAVELLTGQVLERGAINLLGFREGQLSPHWLYTWADGRVAAIRDVGLNRHLVALALLSPAGLLAARATLTPPWARLVQGIGITAGLFAILRGESETAKLAVVVGAATWALCLVSQTLALRLVAAGWVVAAMLILPGLQVAYKTGLDRSPWLLAKLERGSAADRFSILSTFVKRIGEAPLIGHGVNAAYVLGASEKREAVQRTGDPEAEPGIAQHPHNAYLQVWFDLGLIGAALFTAFGLAVLDGIRRLRPAVQPYALATFTSAAAILAPSYGLWQFWYMAMFGVATVAVAMAVRAGEAAEETGPRPFVGAAGGPPGGPQQGTA